MSLNLKWREPRKWKTLNANITEAGYLLINTLMMQP